MKYVTIQLPEEMGKAIDWVLQERPELAYRTRAEFCIETLRNRLYDLGAFEKRKQ